MNAPATVPQHRVNPEVARSRVHPDSKASYSLPQAYKAALGDLQTGDFDSTAPRAYSSLYAELAATNAGEHPCQLTMRNRAAPCPAP